MLKAYRIDFMSYFAVLRRQFLVFAIAFVVILAGTIVITASMPLVYQSMGTVAVESQQIPSDYVQTTVTSHADERIEMIKQRVMTRENLLRIIEKYPLLKAQHDFRSASELVDQLRSHILIELVSASSSGIQRPNATIAFKVSFENRSAELAYQISNELINLFLDENVKVRTERATQTAEFLSHEAEKLRFELETLENKIATYKQQHGNALPENVGLTTSTIQRLETELSNVDREYKATQEELQALTVELSTVGAVTGVPPPGGEVVLSPRQELKKARGEHTRLQALYTDDHPDVRAIIRKISVLEETLRTGKASGSGEALTADELAVARIEARLALANTRIASLSQQRRGLRTRLENLESGRLQAPQIERELLALTRDQQNAQRKYEEIRAKQMTAQIAKNLEGDNKAERFSLLEPPLMPDKPIRPNRKKMAIVGFFLALGGAIGLAITLEAAYGGVLGAENLESVIGNKPLALIPYIITKDEIDQQKRLTERILFGLTIASVTSLMAAHLFYMPLDALFMKVVARFL